jgi:hypothetical protein
METLLVVEKVGMFVAVAVVAALMFLASVEELFGLNTSASYFLFWVGFGLSGAISTCLSFDLANATLHGVTAGATLSVIVVLCGKIRSRRIINELQQEARLTKE